MPTTLNRVNEEVAPPSTPTSLAPSGEDQFEDQDGNLWVTQVEAARRTGITMQGISRAATSGRLARFFYMGRFYISLASLGDYKPVERSHPGPRKRKRRKARRPAARRG